MHKPVSSLSISNPLGSYHNPSDCFLAPKNHTHCCNSSSALSTAFGHLLPCAPEQIAPAHTDAQLIHCFNKFLQYYLLKH